MTNNKKSRNGGDSNADRQHNARDVADRLGRDDGADPPTEPAELDAFDAELEAVAFPATGADIVASVGDREVETAEGTYALADLVPDVETETFEYRSALGVRVEQPTVAAAMKRILEAAEPLQSVTLHGSQRKAYEKTFRELKAIDIDDEDEGVGAITEWILERIEGKGKPPGSRAVRRQAAKFCRANGYPIRNDEWLGV